MSSLNVFVGLDYSQDAVEVAVLDEPGNVLCNQPCANRADWIVELVTKYGRPVGAAIECGTGAADLVDELVERFGWCVDMAHPGFVSRMKQNPDKSDFKDAHLLADLERVGYLPRVWLAPKWIRELRKLVRYRQTLVQQRRAAKLRIRALLRDARQRAAAGINPWTKAWWVWVENRAELGAESRWVLQRERREVERKTADIVEVDARLTEVTAGDGIVAKLLGQRGIGPVTAWTLRAEVGHFGRFRTGKQLARFCGLSPCNASSGNRQADAGLIKAANPALRAVLIETAHRLGRLEQRWVQMKNKLKARGKPACVVAAAIANRWVRWLYHQMVPTASAA